MSPGRYRKLLAARLVRARGSRSVHSCDESGVGHQVISRLESTGNKSVSLETLYLLADYYGVSLRELLSPVDGDLRRIGSPTGEADDLPPWPELDVHVRRAFRRIRKAARYGARRLANATNHPRVIPSWIFRIESGDTVTLDVIRLQAAMEVLDGTVADLLPPPSSRMRDDVEPAPRDTRPAEPSDHAVVG